MTDTVVVTGASRGLGRFCAEQLHEAGYRVVGLGRSRVEAPFEMRTADVADSESVAAALKDLRREPSLYALINAAGIASMNLVITSPAETVRRIVETNLLGTIFCCQQIAPALIKRGTGRIINFSSSACKDSRSPFSHSAGIFASASSTTSSGKFRTRSSQGWKSSQLLTCA